MDCADLHLHSDARSCGVRPPRARGAKPWWVVVLGVALASGCGNKQGPNAGTAPAGAAAPALDRAGLGSATPKVDVIAFVGFQCPHCKTSAKDLLAAVEAQAEVARLRIVQLPLDAHPDSVTLARGAVAARKLGVWRRYWDFVYGLETVDGSAVAAFASQPGVEKAKYEALLQAPETQDEVAWDVALAAALGVAGTPSYLVNGALLQGAQDRATWDGILKTQAEAAAALLQAGTKGEALLQALVEKNSPKRAPFYAKHVLRGERPPEAPVPAKVERKSGIVGAEIAPVGTAGAALGPTLRFGDTGGDPNAIWRVLVRQDDPVRGPALAPVTVVVFGDYECPYTAQLQPTLAALQRELGDKVRVVWKHNPLAIHAHARAAALAAEAARGQGKFWQMHDALFAAGAPLDAGKIEGAATAAGLAVDAWRTALAAQGVAERIQGDIEQVDALSMRGTPNLYVNGRHLVGAVSAATLRATVDAELKRAEAALASGTQPAALYDKLVAEGKLLDSLAAEPATIDTAGGVTRGLPGAAVHIVAFQDFQCPFSARLDPHLRAIEAEFDGKVKVTWMDFPLVEIHPQALMAAQVGREAAAQGKFWELHKLVMERQDKLSRDALVAMAKEAGMDVAALDKNMRANKYGAEVERARAQGVALGLKGTPSVFINGLAFRPSLGFSADTFRVAVQRVLRARE